MKTTFTGFFIAFALFLYSCPGIVRAEEGKAPQQITIAHWGQQNILLYLPLYVAIERGFFAKRGLDVKLKYSGNDDQVFATVVSGDAQFGIGDPAFAAIARQRGFPGKVVAMLVVKIGLSGYTGRDDLPQIREPRDLAGLRVGSFPAPSTTFTLLTQVARNLPAGVRPPKIVELAIGAQAAGLSAGSVDIATDLEPAVSVAESNGKKVVFSLDRFTEELAITGLTTTERMIASDPDAVRKTVEALEAALIEMSRSPETAVEVAQKTFPELPPEVCRTAVNRMLSLGVYPRSARIDAALWTRSLQLRHESGELKTEIADDASVDNSFAQLARAQLGEGK